MKRLSILFLILFCCITSQKSFARFVFFSHDSGFDIQTGMLQCDVSKSTYFGKLINRRQPGLQPLPTYAARGDFYFQNGIYSDGLYEMVFTGTYSSQPPAGRLGCQFLLPGSGLADFTIQAPMHERILITGAGNYLRGQPLFVATNAVTLANPSAELIINIQSELNASIVMNGGTVTLGSDLPLKDDVKLTGSGTINFNTYNLFLGQSDLVWTDTLRLVDAENIVLGAKSSVRGQWKFQNDAHIVGNNYLLDLTNGGSLFIKPNTTLRMSNLTLKGLGTGSIIFERPSSTLELFNVIIDMDKNVTITMGNIYVAGDSTVVTRDKFLVFDRTSSLSVDRSTFFYDNLSYNDQNNVQFTSLANNFASINGGSVRKVRSLQVGDYIIDSDMTLDRSLVVSPLKRLFIEDNATINGDGFAYMFARQATQAIFDISAGKRVKFVSTLLKDMPFATPGINFGSSSSQLIVGHNSQFELGDSGILNNTLMFDGVSYLNGNGKILEFGTNGALVLRPGATLLIDNVTFRKVSGSKIRCMDNRCTVSFGSVVFKQDNNFSFTQGRLAWVGEFDLIGSSTFSYATNQASHISSFGTVYVDKDMMFKYEPPTDNRDLIIMDSDAATMWINGGNLSSTTTGIRLTKGTLMVDGHSYIQNYGAVADSEAISLGNGTPADDSTLILGAGATMELLSGKILYDNQL